MISAWGCYYPPHNTPILGYLNFKYPNFGEFKERDSVIIQNFEFTSIR
nr:MAG TPA_asm: hypothetical protein [Caudoviricetes sp.]